MKNYLKTSNIGIIFGYIIGLLLGNVLGMIIFSIIASKMYDLDLTTVFSVLKVKDISQLDQAKANSYYFVNALTNLLCYVFMFIITVFYARGYLKEDYNKTRKLSRKIWLYLAIVFIGVAIIYLTSSIITYLTYKISNSFESSSNQQTLENLIMNNHKISVFISVVFLAPVVEELVYRKAVFSFFSQEKKILPIIVSSFLFALPHMLALQSSFWIWLLLFLSYFISGLILSMVYSYTNKNVYCSILCHMLNNIIAFILMIF